MKKQIREQVERILDEESGRVHSVIVQMESPDEELRAMLDASIEAMQRRHLTTSPRELLPPKADVILKDADFTATERRHLRASQETMTSQIALAAIQTSTVQSLRQAGFRVVADLMKSDVVQEAIAAAVNRSRHKDRPPEGFRSFWSSQSAVLRLRRDDLHRLPEAVPNISAIFPNRSVRLPPVLEVKQVSEAVADYKTSAWGIEKIGALAAWGAYGTKGKHRTSGPIKVAVLDTGVDPDHPELLNKVVEWAEFDENGERVSDSLPYDSGEHGPHVCGTIAGGHPGAPNGHPWIGVAPDVDLAVGMVLKGGAGTDAQILAGIDWAIEVGAEVINMSLGAIALEPDVADLYTRSILNANRLGIPVVVSIGNEGAQTSGVPGNDLLAFAVGATDTSDRPGGFSGGRTQIIRESRYIADEYLPLVYMKPDVSAPGVAIQSCIPKNRYAVWNGTSMAAPHVTGAIALLLAATDIRSVPEPRRAFLLQDLLVSSVEEIGESGKDHRYGFGRINVLRAIAHAKEQGY
ncbi:S8 family serine peptidase [Leptolyngbya sp. FACHB-8]|uniref:S8 family serine peptidase n=1 Tax=unclassified Leptolyngbya TaxID=2650499 RepID=UPI001682B8D0|nr:S8 family serine peptidase [Leptolyngbya sp. FACHB-8]MBD1913140.1 S8 family serine peptidase [Leptolyngbya sp. FACHB-8]